MIGVKEAVQSAKKYLLEVFGNDSFEGVQVEETKISDDERYWFITLSLYLPSNKPKDPFSQFTSGSPISIMATKDYEHQYKQFTIESDSGRCIEMKMRNFNGK